MTDRELLCVWAGGVALGIAWIVGLACFYGIV